MNPEDVLNIKNDLLFYTKAPQYQQGFLFTISEPGHVPKETYCNNYARDALDSTVKRSYKDWAHGFGGLISFANYDISAIRPGVSIFSCIVDTPIEVAYQNLRNAANNGEVKELTAEQAKIEADSGELVHVISINMNHEAIVIPDYETKWDANRGNLIAQAGAYNGILYESDKRTFGAYPDWNKKDIKYYLYPKRK